ncbi:MULTISPECIES: HupE/UreJ family protein [Rhizobium]|uniref:HupE/UreJ family protein n=1 Tax=Rhizobium TaxID=379 RepID=UPI001B31D1AA|nr:MULTISPECIES: HupE/UreJ family protein [Rhizobium]MBX4910249.1 HupE/UreJ family protein [Rhizobium bangladeshense]MBX5226097.1 HupE/UreJ family protein [Rhizobium sp. NLR9b]MBX5231774.1 HupE/UreJ family protein [Rhizobium sp. NLR4a]MBX5237098.1 HupE/UreJ family protein [Rhizobium sp. NLR22b]MBX5249400.1 HupE/UreJ family protein [Rhizobium sp. NLR4b]
MMRFGALLAVLVPLFLATSGIAHEIRPAYLDLRETARDEFAVIWKVPAQGNMRLSLNAILPKPCVEKTDRARSIGGSAYLQRWTVICAGGLKGGEITIDGLRSTMTEALVRIAYQNGDTEVVRLMPAAPSFAVAGAKSSLDIARIYFLLGVEHILSGLDHLLFVLALLLLIRERGMLIKTITAFTIAHSITLAGASLGYFSLPQKPVEATIALSIAFVASELVRMKPGETRLSERLPWVVAFVFGLLHGFGFAGALMEMGLPQSDVPLSLLTFNLGVEAGQLIFVAAASVLLGLAGALVTVPPAQARQVGAYIIGTAAMLWLVPRIAGLVA